VTRIAIVDPQPAVRAGLVTLLRGEPGLVPVGAASTAAEAEALVERLHPDLVLLEPLGLDRDGVRLCRRLTTAKQPMRVIAYTNAAEPGLPLALRVAGAHGVVDKLAPPPDLFEAVRIVARGGDALPPLTAEMLDAAAHRVEPEDLALLAMLVDRTPQADVADALRLDRRRVARRVERMLGRIGPRPRRPAAA
jgi:DNA-binding NarL/FixJ family response regulator